MHAETRVKLRERVLVLDPVTISILSENIQSTALTDVLLILILLIQKDNKRCQAHQKQDDRDNVGDCSTGTPVDPAFAEIFPDDEGGVGR